MKHIYCLILVYLITSTALFAQLPKEKVVKFNGDSQFYIGKNLQIFTDESAKMTFEEVKNQPNLFTYSNIDVPNLGIDGKTHWVKFDLEKSSYAGNMFVILSLPNIDQVSYYAVHHDQIDSVKYTVADAINDRQFNHQFYLYELKFHEGERVTCYFKLNNRTQLTVPISITSTLGLFWFLQKEDILSAIYFGLMLSLIFYNGFIYISTRDKNYASYVNYIFWVMFAQLTILGLFERVFQFNNEWLTSRLLTFSGAMSGIATIVFVKTFLQTATSAKRFNKLLNIFLIGYLIAIILLVLGYISYSYKLVNIVAGGGAIVVLILAFNLSKTSYNQSKLFLFAWYIFMISVLIFVLKDYQVLPNNLLTNRAIQIGSIIEALLLSFALADKINNYRKEVMELQVRELAISQENERLIKEQNISLERKVEERTLDLQESNNSLNLTLANLRETQSQLVESEKMASLGQLTAGVAHEINNPINFVTASISPLKRDIQVIWDVMDQLEEIALDEKLDRNEKLKQINHSKDDNEIDYLKEEINFLLKGVQEGAERTAEIVRSLRIFSRVDEDTLKYANINEGVESTLVILNTMLREKIIVERHYQELPDIECYPGKLNQVFMNILTNAIYAVTKKFDENTGGKIEIITNHIQENNTIEIKITDNGIGIPVDLQKRIFEPFFTTKDVGEGTGLGMSIAFKTIERHEGKIMLDSTVGLGTTFTIILPTQQNLQHN
ncbi:sensor histidine kinase [Sphingobacterium sp. HJSM2_6]|uniref:sensor histidine kinase n=1 Tax=Sphingobacterium sp. HJSM2_6 TaxID=3366264 RepID=UPI003BE8438B